MLGDTYAPEWPMHGEGHMSAKLNAGKIKSRMCQQFVNSGYDDMACQHFSRHGWCAYAHGEHEIGQPGGAAAMAAPAPAPKGKGKGKGFKGPGGMTSSPLFGKALGKGYGGYAPAPRQPAAWQQPAPYAPPAFQGHHQAYAPMHQQQTARVAGSPLPHIMIAPGVSIEGSAKLNVGRRKTRVCKQWEASGGDDNACEHFAKHGWCAYAHGEQELQVENAALQTPSDSPDGHVSEKLDTNRRKKRLCQQFIEGGRDHMACSFFARHGWCAYAHGEHELQPF